MKLYVHGIPEHHEVRLVNVDPIDLPMRPGDLVTFRVESVSTVVT